VATEDRKISLNEQSNSVMEDFGRFGPAETSDSDAEITDDSIDPMYGEENAGA